MQTYEMMVALGIPLGTMALAAVIVAVVGHFKNLERRQRAELIRLALEKGQPLPPEALDPPSPARNELGGGIRTIFTGVGLGVFFWVLKPGHPVWAVGLLVVLIGVGRLVAHYVTARAVPASTGRPAA